MGNLHRTDVPINWVCPVNWLHPLNRGLVSWWLCVPGVMGGSRWVDLCGRNAGTLTNMDPATDWVGPRGRPGGWGAVDFDGVNDQVLVPNNSSFDGPPLTISLWAKYSAAGELYLVSNYLTRWILASSLANNGKLSFFSGATWASAATAANDGIWHNLAMTHNGSTTTFYRDGRQDGTASQTITGTRATNLQIGGQASAYFPGLLDSIAIHSRALSPAEVALLYQLSQQRYPGMLNRVAVGGAWETLGGVTYPQLERGIRGLNRGLCVGAA